MFRQGSSTIAQYSYDISDGEFDTVKVSFAFKPIYPEGYYNLEYISSIDGSREMDSAIFLTEDPNPPYIVYIEPDTAAQGEKLTVSLSGEHTHFLQGTSTLRFRQGTSTITPWQENLMYDDTLIVSNIRFEYAHDTGSYDVLLDNYFDGEIVSVNGFYLREGDSIPSIFSVKPDSILLRNQAFDTIRIQFQNAHFNSNKAYSIALYSNFAGELAATRILKIDSNNILARFNTGQFPLGWYDIVAWNQTDGILKMENAVYLYIKTGADPGEIPSDYLDPILICDSIDFRNDLLWYNPEIWLSQNDEELLFSISSDLVNNYCYRALFDFVNNDLAGIYNIKINNGGTYTITIAQALEVLKDESSLPMPIGPEYICPDSAGLSLYYVPEHIDFINYVWTITPSHAGILTPNMHEASILWEPSYTGKVYLTTKATHVPWFGEIEFPSLEIDKINPSLTFSYTIYDKTVTFNNDSEYDYTYYWDFGDTGVDSVKNPVHTYEDYGTYTVSLGYLDPGCGYIGIKDGINIEKGTFADHLIYGPAYRVWPNPASVNFSIEREQFPGIKQRVWLVDNLGRLVKETCFLENQNTIEVSTLGIEAGYYLLLIEHLDTVWRSCLVIQ